MAWCARPDDVIYGKFLAWDEGRSRKHEADIYDMLVFKYLEADPTLAMTLRLPVGLLNNLLLALIAKPPQTPWRQFEKVHPNP